MINMLFVDDEQNVLHGLKRMLRPMRNEWQMSFAPSGEEALKHLETEMVDVIVSDMKMPGMDGAELLKRVRENYPQIVRIVLSGYAETKMIMKSVGEAHQYLAKPCDANALKDSIERACSLHSLMNDKKVSKIVAELRSVPSLPSLYAQLIEELKTPEPSTRKIAEIVKNDIGMTAKLLQIVNSAFFGLQKHISDTSDAIRFLGLETISSLAIGIGVFTQFESEIEDKTYVNRLWNHSALVGSLAKRIAAIENKEMENDSFSAGLLHDIGEVLLAVNMPKEFVKTKSLLKKGDTFSREIELEFFGATHEEIGAYLLSLWGLPREVVEAVAYHHNPGVYQTSSFTSLTAVHIAEAFEASAECDSGTSISDYTDNEYLERIGLSGKIPLWQETCEKLKEPNHN